MGPAQVAVCGVADRTQIGPLSDTESVATMAFSPDRRTLALGEENGTIRLWNLAKLSQTGEPLTGHTGFVGSVVFSPDGTILASCGEDKTVRLWRP